MKTLELEIKGKIWGERSISSITNMAQNISLNGYVKFENNNLEILVQGLNSNLEEFLSWAQKLSFMREVSHFCYKYISTDETYDKFVIKGENFLDKAIKKIKDFTDTQEIDYESLNFQKVPNHIGIIPDGNRRWAREKNWQPWVGHLQVTRNKSKFMEIFEVAHKLGVKYITFWAFSTENWKRDKKEVDMILKLMNDFADELLEEGKNKNIKFKHIGRRDRLPKEILDKFDRLIEETKNNTGLQLNFAVDYGGKDEIVRGVNKLIKNGKNKVEEKDLNKVMDSGSLPPLDLIIRTSGEKRTSGMMLWKSDYAELYFTNTMFPDFDALGLIDAIRDYSKRVRRFGGTNKKDLKNIDTDSLQSDK